MVKSQIDSRQYDMATSHSLRVRNDRWERIEKKAWELSLKANKPIKPTDVADAILDKGIDSISQKDIEEAKLNR